MDEKLKEISKHFDAIFDTNTFENIDFNNLPMLKQLYLYFEEELYKPSPKYEQLRKRQIEISDELEKAFTKKQKDLFAKYWEITNQMSVEEEQQLFMFGFIIAKQLDNESKLHKNTK